jgi:hypothetical protein
VEGIDRLLADLTAWSAEQRGDDAARSRSRERSLRRQAAESATWAGTLVDLAESGAPVVVQVAGGRSHRGVIVGVGPDYVAVQAEGVTLTLIDLAGVASVRSLRSGSTSAAGGSRPPHPRTMMQALAVCAEERPRVRVVAAGETVTGELIGVGGDVLSVRLDADPPTVAYVPAASVSEVSLG